MEIKDLVAVGALVVGVVGLILAWIYRRRDQPRLAYRICQLADYGVDGDFFPELTACPAFIKLKNVGGESLETVHVRLTATKDVPLESKSVKSTTDGQIKMWDAPGPAGATYHHWEGNNILVGNEVQIRLKFKTSLCQKPIGPDDVEIQLSKGRAKLMHDWR